jgi:hypothetical protein
MNRDQLRRDVLHTLPGLGVQLLLPRSEVICDREGLLKDHDPVIRELAARLPRRSRKR